MKKLMVFIFTLVFALSAISASAKAPDFLYEVYTNYTSSASASLSFDSSEDLVKLLEEFDMPEEINNHVDLKALLKSLLSYNTTMTVQADISDDYTKAEIALTADLQYDIDVNKNLNIDVAAKTGMWIKMDLEEEVFAVIYSYPGLNKYMTVDLFELIEDIDDRTEMLDFLKSIFNKEYMEDMQKFSADLMAKHASIKLSRSKCTVKLDNDGFVAMFDEIMNFVTDMMPEDMQTEIPSFEGLQILGDEGITYTYLLTSGKPSKADVKADISVDISKIFAQLTGMQWEYEANGILDFIIETSQQITNYDRTKVEFPKLTEENSFSIMEMMPEPEPDYDDTDWGAEIYPYDYVDGVSEDLPLIDGEIYIPLRMTLGSAYDEMMQITYENGVIVATSDYFPGFKELKLSVNSDLAYLDGQEYHINRVHEENGVSYVSAKTFEELFGWEFMYASFDLFEKYYNYGFYTFS